jgi:hypothetical protein
MEVLFLLRQKAAKMAQVRLFIVVEPAHADVTKMLAGQAS